MVGLKLKKKSKPSALEKLPSGSFTVDRSGKVIVSTLPQKFPADLVQEIARHVLDAFSEATSAKLPLSELVVQYSSLRLTARELRGGAIVFLSPKDADSYSS